MKRVNFLFLIIVILTSIASGCKKDKGDPPILPSMESITIDFSNFQSGAKGAAYSSKGIINTNWKFAAEAAGTFETLTISTLGVPFTALRLAKDQTPSYLSEKTWQWSYTVNVLSSSYKARLVGKIGATDVTWELYVTQEGGSGEFIWMTGSSKTDGSSGQWIFNHSSDFVEPFLQIDWSKSPSDVFTVKYTYVREQTDSRQANPFNGSSIEYGKTSNPPFDAYYNIHVYLESINNFANVNIEWNMTSLNGRVKSLEYFGNSNWFCWNSQYGNVVCQ